MFDACGDLPAAAAGSIVGHALATAGLHHTVTLGWDQNTCTYALLWIIIMSVSVMYALRGRLISMVSWNCRRNPTDVRARVFITCYFFRTRHALQCIHSTRTYTAHSDRRHSLFSYPMGNYNLSNPFGLSISEQFWIKYNIFRKTTELLLYEIDRNVWTKIVHLFMHNK